MSRAIRLATQEEKKSNLKNEIRCKIKFFFRKSNGKMEMGDSCGKYVNGSESMRIGKVISALTIFFLLCPNVQRS